MRKELTMRDHINALLKVIFEDPDIPQEARTDLLVALSNLSCLIRLYCSK